MHRISKWWAIVWWSSIGLSFFERPIRRGFAETSDWSFNRKTYTWSSPKSSRSWNPADFTMKSSRFHEIHEIWQISPWNLVDFRWNHMFQKSAADVSAKTLLILQGLGWISPDICRISWNLLDFTWNLPDFMKSAGFHTDFMKSGRFHEIHEIWWISGEIRCFRNQLQMFQQKLFWFYKVWGGFHLKSAVWKSKDLCKELLLYVL